MNLGKRANDITLVAFCERGWNSDKNAALKQIVSHRTNALGILHSEAGVLGKIPRETEAIDARLLHEADNVVVKMKAPLGHHDI